MTRHGWWPALACAAAIAGCNGPTAGSDGGPTADAGPMGVDGGGDVCAGRTLCTTAGTSCDGDDLVTCAEDANGCMVETRSDCGASDQVCDASGGTAACVDACAAIAEEDRCETADVRACNGDVLEVCTMDTNGCLVLERMTCSDMPDGVCDDSGTMPVCAAPADPCADIPAEMRCDTEGTSCDGDDLVTCAANAFGCLVTTTTDCTSRAGGTCDDSDTAACTFTGDPCDDITECTTAGTSCDGPELVTCAADAFGCMVETRTDCTSAAFGFCDADANMCGTAATDPCMGMTSCGTSASTTCSDDTTISSCRPNAFGCFVSTDTDCSASNQFCSDASGTPACITDNGNCAHALAVTSDAVFTGEDISRGGATPADDEESCSYAEGEQALYYAVTVPAGETVIGHATPTSDVDLVIFTLAACGDTTCTGAEDDPEVIALENDSGADETIIVGVRTYDSGETGTFDISFTQVRPATNTTCGTATAITGTTTLRVQDLSGGGASPTGDNCGGGSGDYALYYAVTVPAGQNVSVDAAGTSDLVVFTQDACDATDCTDASDDPEHVFLTNPGATDLTTIVGVRSYGTTAGLFDVSFTYATMAPNAACAGAIDLGAAPTTLTGVDSTAGGAPPSGSDCGFAPGPDLYYSLTVPPSTRANVTVTPSATLDVQLRTFDSCGATSCLDSVDDNGDGDAETVAFTNSGSSDVTFYFSVASSFGAGPFDLEVTQSTLASNGTCASPTTITTDTTLTGEDVSLGGPRPVATSCGGPEADSPTLYYAVTVPNGSGVTATATPTTGGDIVLSALGSCSDDECVDSADSGFSGGPETLTYLNGSGAAATFILVARAWDEDGQMDLSFAYEVLCGNGDVDPGEECDDGATSDGDGCSATCTLETADATYTATGLPLDIVDDDETMPIMSSVTATACTVAWVRVTWSITHTWGGDVTVDLVAPDGTTRARLIDSTPTGIGSGDDLLGPYTFAAGGASWPGSGDPVASGVYGYDFSSFVGLDGSGTWTLEVFDNGAGDTGTLEGWSLDLGCM